MSNSIKILFWLNKARVNKKGQSPLMLRLTYNNERKQVSTGLNVSFKLWDNDKGRVKSKDEVSNEVNSYIATTTAKVHELFTEQLRDGDIYLDRIIDKLFGKNEATYTLMQLANYQMNIMNGKLGKDYAIATVKKYEVTLHKLEKFLFSLGKKDIRLKDLNLKFIHDFDYYMKTNLGNDHNTTVKHCKNLKTFINVGITNGWIEKNPFTSFKCPYKVKEKVYLNQQELELIKQKQFSMPRLALVKDLFLFQCYTGLSYTDMANLTGKDVTIGIDKQLWIIVYRQKTNIRCSIPLLAPAIEVIKKHNPNFRDEINKPLLPMYSNQKFNSYLKEIADLCGISKELSSHAGRRTFATTIALANNVSIETIRAIIGHSQSSKITYQYAAVTDLKVAQEIDKIRKLV